MMSLSDVSRMLDAPMTGPDAEVSAVVTDTRAIKGGELFVALQGPNHDAHDFVADAAEKGASGFMVSRDVDATVSYVTVTDTMIGLGSLASEWRRGYELPVVAITGSNGKTTVKQMTGSILRAAFGAGVVTRGNFNNHIGLPLTVLRLRESDQFAVLEMGMSAPGEINYLSGLAAPTVSVVLNAAAAHLEGLGDVQAVARAKGEIFNGMDMDGVAIIGADDEFADMWRQLAGTRRCIRFAVDADAEITATYALSPNGTRIDVMTPSGGFSTVLSVPGVHNVKNALAATAAAFALDVDLDCIAQGLRDFEPEAGRLEIHALNNDVTLINDTYNANPASARAAVDVLSLRDDSRVLVIGDMAELGPDADVHHHELGVYAREKGVETLLALGDLSRSTVEGFGDGATHHQNIDSVIAAVAKIAEQGSVTLLIKGSRSMQMERVIAALLPSQSGVAH